MGSENLSPTLLNSGLGHVGPMGLAHIDGSKIENVKITSLITCLAHKIEDWCKDIYNHFFYENHSL